MRFAVFFASALALAGCAVSPRVFDTPDGRRFTDAPVECQRSVVHVIGGVAREIAVYDRQACLQTSVAATLNHAYHLAHLSGQESQRLAVFNTATLLAGVSGTAVALTGGGSQDLLAGLGLGGTTFGIAARTTYDKKRQELLMAGSEQLRCAADAASAYTITDERLSALRAELYQRNGSAISLEEAIIRAQLAASSLSLVGDKSPRTAGLLAFNKTIVEASQKNLAAISAYTVAAEDAGRSLHNQTVAVLQATAKAVAAREDELLSPEAFAKEIEGLGASAQSAVAALQGLIPGTDSVEEAEADAEEADAAAASAGNDGTSENKKEQQDPNLTSLQRNLETAALRLSRRNTQAANIASEISRVVTSRGTGSGCPSSNKPSLLINPGDTDIRLLKGEQRLILVTTSGDAPVTSVSTQPKAGRLDAVVAGSTNPYRVILFFSGPTLSKDAKGKVTITDPKNGASKALTVRLVAKETQVSTQSSRKTEKSEEANAKNTDASRAASSGPVISSLTSFIRETWNTEEIGEPLPSAADDEAFTTVLSNYQRIRTLNDEKRGVLTDATLDSLITDLAKRTPMASDAPETNESICKVKAYHLRTYGESPTDPNYLTSREREILIEDHIRLLLNGGNSSAVPSRIDGRASAALVAALPIGPVPQCKEGT